MQNAFDTLQERGFVYQVSDAAGLRAALEQPIVAYCGYDPTDSSLTHGNLVTIMMLAHLQRAGHRPIALVGGGTGMVGDPSDKTSARPILTIEEIDSNVANFRGQLSRFLDFGDGRADLVNNAEWLRSIGYLDFLRDVGKHFSINVMLDLEFVRSRLAGQAGLTYLEFSYILLQAYDYLELYRRYGCTLQVGGSDQWANILAGADLIRRVEGGKAYGLVAPLVTASSGRKVSKSEGTAIYLDPARTSPYEFYQFWINTEDADVERYLGIYTFLPMEDVRRLGRLEGADIRRAKEILAYEVTSLVHGEVAANEARETSQALFGVTIHAETTRAGARALPATIATGVQAFPSTILPMEEVSSGIAIIDVLPRTGLASSKRDARRLIDQRGIRLNGEEITSVDRVLNDADFTDGEAILLKGRKTFHRLLVQA